jgi:hypothetical protein
VWLLSNYNESFEVESVSSRAGIVNLKSQEQHDNGCKLTLEINPPLQEYKARSFSDTIFVNISGGEKLEVGCRGYYQIQPQRQN